MTADDHKALKRSYRETIEVVTEVINDWDPYDLIKSGAPDNEFSHEVARIAAKAHEIKTSMELAEVISSVFIDQFGPEYFSVEACVSVAARLCPSGNCFFLNFVATDLAQHRPNQEVFANAR